MAIDDKDGVAIEQFFGLRNNVKPEHFALGDLESAVNIDISDELKPRTRRGYSPARFAGAYHSIYANAGVMLGVLSGALMRLSTDGYTATAIRSGITDRLSYAAVGNRIFYTDGLVTGCVESGEHRSWGIEPPSAQPVATASGGGCPAGTYQYAVTYLRADGQESGTGASGTITLTSPGGIEFSAIPVPADSTVVAKNLYVSPVNGDMLYRVQTLESDATTATYPFEIQGTIPLATQFKQPPIAGQLIAEFSGRVLLARGRRLHVTEPYAHELMDLRRGFSMASRIVLLAPVDDGVYLGTGSEVIFLPGNDPAKWEYKAKLGYGAIPGTVAYVNAEDLGPELSGEAAIFATKEGVCVGFPGGTIKNLTKERFQYPLADRGAAVVRKHGGMIQYLMVLEGTETAANSAF